MKTTENDYFICIKDFDRFQFVYKIIESKKLSVEEFLERRT